VSRSDQDCLSSNQFSTYSCKLRSIFLGILIVFWLTSCRALLASTPPVKFDNHASNPSDENADSWYQVYFTQPGGALEQSLRGGPDADLAEAIQAAVLSVDIAMDDLDLWSVRNALIAAHQHGVTVRAVVESDNLDQPEVQDLIEAGIPIVDDRHPGMMHNKFAIIDRLVVYTGSMNLTLNGAYRSDNNLIHIRSADLAEDYLAEFEEMFEQHQFGPDSPSNTTHPEISLEDARLEVYFSPDDGTQDRLLELIASADQSISFLAYAFTSEPLADALIQRAQEGLSVSGVVDENQASNADTQLDNLRAAGIPVRLDGNPHSMHHKVLLIDGEIVVTGSYNFSNNAEMRNDENTLIIYNKNIAELYQAEFERVYKMAH
jgi:phosphatidylserine/phosphatidylglycerophosphate/cardiolipin synthase-like enzyme